MYSEISVIVLLVACIVVPHVDNTTVIKFNSSDVCIVGCVYNLYMNLNVSHSSNINS